MPGINALLLGSLDVLSRVSCPAHHPDAGTRRRAAAHRGPPSQPSSATRSRSPRGGPSGPCQWRPGSSRSRCGWSSRASIRSPSRRSPFKPLWVMEAVTRGERLLSRDRPCPPSRGFAPGGGRDPCRSGGPTRWTDAQPGGDPVMTAKFLAPVMNAPGARAPAPPSSADRGGRRPGHPDQRSGRVGQERPRELVGPAGAVPGPVAGYSLDEEDDLPGVFWTYRPDSAPTGRGGPRRGTAAHGAGTDRPFAGRATLGPALGAFRAARPGPGQRRDDHAAAIFDDLDFLVRHAAGRLRLVLVTRADPALPLPQYRLQGGAERDPVLRPRLPPG